MAPADFVPVGRGFEACGDETVVGFDCDDCGGETLEDVERPLVACCGIVDCARKAAMKLAKKGRWLDMTRMLDVSHGMIWLPCSSDFVTTSYLAALHSARREIYTLQSVGAQ